MAKDYRNLIHRGASERTGQVCDLGSAHHAVAALDHVVRDLTKQIAASQMTPRDKLACLLVNSALFVDAVCFPGFRIAKPT